MELRELQVVNPGCRRAVIVAALQQHSALGLHMLYVEYTNDVRKVVVRRLGVQAANDDIVHETLLQVSERIEQLRDFQKFESWIYTIAKNKSYKYLRQYQRVSIGVPDLNVADPEILGPTGEQYDIVKRASKGLSVRDQRFLEMLVSEELGWQEIGEQLSTSLVNVYKLHRRVEERLAQSSAALELAISHRFSCENLSELLTGWTGEYSPLWRKRITRHAQQCTTCVEAIKKTPASRLGSF
jgi:RNA polymerase sigma factor (sigma-70 family)